MKLRVAGACIMAAAALVTCACEDDSTGFNVQDKDENGGSDSNQNGQPDTDQKDEGSCSTSCPAGIRVCSLDGNAMICGDFNGDGCRAWDVVECKADETCQNGVCVNKSDPEHVETCEDECPEANKYECTTTADGKPATRVCTNTDADSCLEWSDLVACRDGFACNDGKCSCVDECSENGKRECSGNGYRTCADSDLDGCLEWSGVTACEATCKNGACQCKNECTENARECSGAGYRTCTKDSAGCFKWSAVVKCDNGCASGECKSPEIMEPTRYPGDRVLSPVTAYVVQSMKTIAAKNPSRQNLNFMKVGDSHMYSGSVFMYCFSKTGPKGGMNLNGETNLNGVIDAYQSSGFDSFHRDSVSAVLGKTAYWAVSGSYITQEIAASNPRFGFYGYGTNDMGWFGYAKPAGSSTGYYYTLQWYYRYTLQAMKSMMNAGVIPMIIGTGVRTDKPSVDNSGLLPIHWVKLFDAVGRGVAEAYQIPYYNLQLSQQSLSNYGLGSDGIHHKHVGKGCEFTSSGLQGGANTRNHHAIQMLDKAWRTVVGGEEAPDMIVPYIGMGTKSSPYDITSLPFTHSTSSKNGQNHFSTYKCSSASEAGPEIYYKLTLTSSKKLRVFAVSADNVDVDLYLKKTLADDSCVTRGDKWIEASLGAGTYYFVVDTYGSSSNAGEYLFGVIECDSDDAYCASTTTGG